MALPQSMSFAARLQNLQQYLAGLSASYNPQRRSLAYETAAGLNEAGYTDDALPQEIQEGGDIAYRIVRGPDGRLYRQAFRQTVSGHAGRGTLQSSFAQRDLREDKRGLDVERERVMRGFGSQQAGITERQAGAFRDTSAELGQARGDYADWQAQQPVALPAPPTAPQLPAMQTPAAPTGNPRVLWQGQTAPNIATLDKRYGAGGYQIRKRGPKVGGYVAVRR